MQIKNRSTNAVLLLFSFPLMISLCYGFQYRVVGSGMDNYFRGWSLLWFVALIGMTLYALLRDQLGPVAVPVWIGLGFSSASLALTSYFFLSKAVTMPIWVSFATLPAVLTIWLARRDAALAIRLLGLAGLVLNLILIAQIPHTAGANMLEIIEAASADLLAGKYPYRVYEDIAHASFGYLPGLWLPYVPLVWLGLDVRILNVLCLLSLVWLFERGLGLEANKRAAILGATLYPLLLSPAVSQMLVHGHVWPYWIFTLTALVLLARERYWPAALLLGLALATRQPALWLVPPVAGWVVARLGMVNAVKYGALTLAVYLVVVLPFAIPSGIEFWQVVYLNLSGFETAQPHINAAVWLELWSLNTLLRPLQMMVLLGAMIWLYRRKAEFATFAMVLGLSYLWAVYFNGYSVRYVYIPGFLIVMTGFVIHLSRTDDARAERELSRSLSASPLAAGDHA